MQRNCCPHCSADTPTTVSRLLCYMSSENSQAALQGMTDSNGRFPSSRLCPYIPGGFRQHTLRTVPLAPKKRNAAWKIPAGAQVGRRSPSPLPRCGHPEHGAPQTPLGCSWKNQERNKVGSESPTGRAPLLGTLSVRDQITPGPAPPPGRSFVPLRGANSLEERKASFIH